MPGVNISSDLEEAMFETGESLVCLQLKINSVNEKSINLHENFLFRESFTEFMFYNLQHKMEWEMYTKYTVLISVHHEQFVS